MRTFDADYHDCCGTYIWPDGRKYQGQFKQHKYHVEFVSLKCIPHGKGTETWPSGRNYQGEFKNREPHGVGTETWPDGWKYEGEFKDGRWHGKGTETWPSGRKYEGEFKDGRWHGKGTETRPDGRRYEAVYQKGKRTGKGTLTLPDGRKYVGDFYKGRIHGKGILTAPDGSKHEGDFQADRPNGKGTLTLPDGRKYVGDFQDGKFHGKGKFTWLDGCSFEGEFEEGQGLEGVYIWPDGCIFKDWFEKDSKKRAQKRVAVLLKKTNQSLVRSSYQCLLRYPEAKQHLIRVRKTLVASAWILLRKTHLSSMSIVFHRLRRYANVQTRSRQIDGLEQIIEDRDQLVATYDETLMSLESVLTNRSHNRGYGFVKKTQDAALHHDDDDEPSSMLGEKVAQPRDVVDPSAVASHRSSSTARKLTMENHDLCSPTSGSSAVSTSSYLQTASRGEMVAAPEKKEPNQPHPPALVKNEFFQVKDGVVERVGLEEKCENPSHILIKQQYSHSLAAADRCGGGGADVHFKRSQVQKGVSFVFRTDAARDQPLESDFFLRKRVEIRPSNTSKDTYLQWSKSLLHEETLPVASKVHYRGPYPHIIHYYKVSACIGSWADAE